MGSKIKWLNLALRAVMETGIVLAFGYWGWQGGDSTAAKLLLGFGAPLVSFGFWGLVDFRQAGQRAEVLRLIQELFISLLAAAAFYSVGAAFWGWMLALISILYHVLVYLTGEKLLK